MLQSLLTPASVPPQFVPLPDGGVQAEWLVGGDSLEIEVSGEGEAFVFGVDADGGVAVEGDPDAQVLGAAARRLSYLSERVGAFA
ncbi:MAG: hypothetical protein M0Z30_08730 [Actinomycetota bacterium]|nr:hypothetical protein [Actinomycetota bacterium]